LYVEYCYETCPIGKVASEVFLDLNNSVLSAVDEFDRFTVNCSKTCPFSNRHENKCITKEHSV
jgi:hypothetical protein